MGPFDQFFSDFCWGTGKGLGEESIRDSREEFAKGNNEGQLQRERRHVFIV